MISPNFDVVIVGGGCAGMTAAIGLVKSGFSVAVVEAAPFPGAENWSGCVYFCENLAHPDILGPDGVEALAWERRLVERGFFATDGHGLLGMTYRDPEAFRHCFTVLRPIFDHHIAQIAAKLGVAILNETTAESLIRDGNRVIGVATQRGPIYADLVFLAEGDASHLVTREGYERFPDKREAPKFLQGIKQVIDLPPGTIEETFKVGPEEGVAYEMLIRNGSLRGKSVHLNMGGFVYANRQSLSVGLVLPADNLHQHFGGDPKLLIEWFEQLPALKPWLKLGKRGVFGAKIIRGGGARDIPRLIDDGLAIGGAASAVGIDFPYPNFTGPATRMGLLLVQAARRIREEKGRFTQENLEKHYLQPLQQTHHWQDVEFLRRWPSYVKKTSVFFDSQIDLALGTAYVWTRRDRWFLSRWLGWARLAWDVAGPSRLPQLREDSQHLAGALRLGEVVGRPSIWRMMLDGGVNALRDLFGSPRRHLPPAGEVRLHYTVAGGAEPAGAAPWLLDRWARRFLPVLASAARRVYRNDDEPLKSKLQSAVKLLFRQVNILDVVAAGALAVAAGASSAVLAGWLSAWSWLTGKARSARRTGLYADYARAVRQVTDLTPITTAAAQHWESRLSQLVYRSVKESHIHVHWPQSLPDRGAVAQQGLWHVCPARVYEARVTEAGQVQVVVNFENCIKCETCWRTSDLVDWARDGQHRFIYPVHSSLVSRLLQAGQNAGVAVPAAPRTSDAWDNTVHELAAKLRSDRAALHNGHYAAEIAELHRLAGQLDRKLDEFAETLAEEPRTIDKPRAAYLELLARYAHELAARMADVLGSGSLADSPRAGIIASQRQILMLLSALASRAEERVRRTRDQRYSWAAAEGRQIQQHHLAGIRRLLGLLGSEVSGDPLPGSRWLSAENDAAETALQRAEFAKRLDAVFPRSAWRDSDRGTPLSSEQDACLRDLLAQVPEIDPNHLATSLHPPLRKALLAELGRRDPSLAYRAACHLWARDLAGLASGGSSILAKAAQRWAHGDEWACFVNINGVQASGTGWHGEALLVPARFARSFLLLVGGNLTILPAHQPPAELVVEPLATLGLRGAGMTRVRLANLSLPEQAVPVDHSRLHRAWSILSAADLTSIASGMADELCDRALVHATSRVQFPGLFLDEDARDTIGKFGAVKKMIAEMAARRFLLETLDHAISPVDLSGPSAAHAGLVKAIVAESLGTSPGSLAYNAAQVMGGTGFSEDDIFAKFYRDAAAWRFLGPGNIEVYRRHGEAILHGWRADGQRLASLTGEAEVFDQLAQRKALQAELDAIRVFRSQLRTLVNEWQGASGSSSVSSAALVPVAGARPTFAPCARAEVSEGLGRQDAHLLASKVLLLRLHARMERGLNSETEAALVRVWLQRAAAGLAELGSQVQLQFAVAGERDEEPVIDRGNAAPVTTYAAFLAATNPYDSGDFLEQPVNVHHPRFIPEMIEVDPALAARNAELRERIAGYFGQARDGLPYERHVERSHRPDAADLDFCRRSGFFRFPIPRELGGEARPKVEYYLLTTACQRLADVAISLTIQVNSSLGTSPVLLARGKDLPRAEKDVAAFVSDAALHADVTRRLDDLLRLVRKSEPAAIDKTYRELHERVEKMLGSAAIRALAHRFADAWEQAGLAGRAFDLAGMQQHLADAVAEWNAACQRAADYAAELARRREASDQFLRWIAGGQISAFALTEPSAGSDTARVATRAVLRSVPVDREADGVLRFVPFGGNEPRYLLDARKVEFQAHRLPPVGVAAYRFSADADAATIHFDEYDYETDDPRRLRFYDHGGRRVHFTDIAQLRDRDGRLWYDYWELTGAKMWITNGRMCGVMCLYAKTEEGITGFMVDRHAEGLVVGKDEEKLGQCGSPTNELSLQAVRVPRENVIGIEGRGQVNALETLNIGRAGLAMSAMAQMQGLIEQSRAFAQSTYGEVPDWVEWRLARMEEEQFFSEAVAHEVIGQFEHPQTKSVRLESAIAKALVSESLHRVIELAEDIHGLAGQTQFHLVEKRKRDARVLTIYEGTNEIQRFFLLKDLAATKGKPNTGADSPKMQPSSREVLELEALRLGVRDRVRAALELFGQDLWQNPNLQANGFLVSEAVMWLKAADSALARVVWLEAMGSRKGAGGKNHDDSGALPSARSAVLRCSFEVQNRLRRFDKELGQLRRGCYAEEVRAARLLFARIAKIRGVSGPVSRITRPLAVLVVVEPTAAQVPQPHVDDGQLAEPHWTLTPADRAALETALRLRDQAVAPVSVHVAGVGPRGAGAVFREALSLGADRAVLLLAEGGLVANELLAAATATLLRSHGPFDLVLGGNGKPAHEDGLMARITAEAMGVPQAGSAATLAVHATESDSDALLCCEQQRFVRSLPAMVAIEPELSLRSFTVDGYLAGLARSVDVQRIPRRLEGPAIMLVTAIQAEPQSHEEAGQALNPAQAAGHILHAIGARGRSGSVAPFAGEMESVAAPEFGNKIVALLAADAGGQLDSGAAVVVRAAEALTGPWNCDVTVWVLASIDEEAQRRAVAEIRSFFVGDVIVLAADRDITLREVRCRLLQECWPRGPEQPRVVVGETWAEAALIHLAIGLDRDKGQDTEPDPLCLRVHHLTIASDHVELETLRAAGKLLARRSIPLTGEKTRWLTVTGETEIRDTRLAQTRHDEQEGKVQRWSPRLERFFARDEIQRLLGEVKSELGVVRLADAEFIIDVGFGVGNRDGYEAVIDPLEKALRELGVRGLVIGGSRKVTEELHLLPADRQIGQSGVTVNPRVLLAIGISGAPQHLNYIGTRATIVAFNRDPESPLMTLNRRVPQPKVFRVVGDLFATMPAFIAALRQEQVLSPAFAKRG